MGEPLKMEKPEPRYGPRMDALMMRIHKSVPMEMQPIAYFHIGIAYSIGYQDKADQVDKALDSLEEKKT